MQNPVTPHHALPHESPSKPSNRKLLPVERIRQKGPSCGTTSLAMALNTLAKQAGKPATYTQASLDAGHRLPFMFSSPQLLVNIARKHGFYAEAYNQLTKEQVQHHLKAGHLVLALGCSSTAAGKKQPIEPLSWHWRLVHGYDDCCDPTHPDYACWADELKHCCVTAGSELLLVSDPHDFSLLTPYEAFAQSFFKPLKLGCFPTTAQQVAVVVSNHNTLPAAKRLPWVLQATHGLGTLIQWLPHTLQTVWASLLK